MRLFLRPLCALAALTFAQAASAGTWGCHEVSAGVRVLSYEGRILYEEEKKFYPAFVQCFPAQYSGQRTLVLDSGGGSVDAALKISRWIAEEGSRGRPIATQVLRDSNCVSACTYMFVSGQLRNVSTGGSFEPHGFSSHSGRRIDVTIASARDKAGNIDWSKVEVQTARLGTLYQIFNVLGSQDPRFAWVSEWTKDFNHPGGRYYEGADVRAAKAFAELDDAQKVFASIVDGVVSVVVPEIERVAALQAFRQVLESAGLRAPTSSGEELHYYVDWMLRGFDSAAQGYLRMTKEARKLVIGDAVRAAVTETLENRIRSVAKTVATDLGPYLIQRSDQVDVSGFVQLMFSTSILYTRPVTREELCDLNIVNRDCAN